MPGIERDRVVGIDEEQLDEMTCGICTDIFDDPIVTECCRQTYCTLCINQWLVDNNTCPNDRQPLDINGLIPSPRVFVNLLNKLKIKCHNYKNGCEVIATNDKMKDHEYNCDKLCANFKETIKQKEEENKTLHIELKNVKKDLEIEKKKLDDFKLSSRRSVEQVIIDTRSVVNDYVIEETDLDERDMQFLIENCQNAINCFTDFFHLTKHIRDKMSDSSGGWSVVALSLKETAYNVGASVTSNKGAVITFANLIAIYVSKQLTQ